MSPRLTLEEALARRDVIPTARPAVSGISTRLLLEMKGPIDRPVSVAKLVAHLGTSLRTGHDAINRIARGESVPVELIVPEGRDIVAEFADLNVCAFGGRRRHTERGRLTALSPSLRASALDRFAFGSR